MSRIEENFRVPNHTVTISREISQKALSTTVLKKCVVVFSPDANLAQFLLLNFEDRFQIIRENRLEHFEQTIKEISPDLILIDLFTFSTDIVKQLDIIQRTAVTVPVIALRAYMSFTPKIDKSIDDLTDIVFYKPVDVELITQAIEDLLK